MDTGCPACPEPTGWRAITGRVLPRLARRSAAAFALAAFAPDPAAAVDSPQDNSRFAPLQVEQATPLEYGKIEGELNGRYERDRRVGRGRDLGVVEPLVRLGAFPGGHVTVAVPYRLGDRAATNQGAGSLGVLYNLNGQTAYLPAFGIALNYDTPFGAGHKTAEYLVRGLATKWLGPSERSPRLHLNLAYTRATQPGAGERADRLEVIAGYSMLLSERTALFFDAVHGARPERRKTQTLLETGVRGEVGGGWYASAGAGVGVGRESPAFRVLFAVQKGFKLF